MVRPATADDARGIADVHVRAWRAAYGGILPKQLLDDLSVDLREEFWRAELGDERSTASTLVAEDAPGTTVGFLTVVGPSRDEDGGDRTAEIAATTWSRPGGTRGWGGRCCVRASRDCTGSPGMP